MAHQLRLCQLPRVPLSQPSDKWVLGRDSNNVVERAFELISDSIAESNNAPSSEGLLSCLEYYLREIQDRLLEFSRFLDSILNLEISPYSDSRIPVERAVSLS
jgi:hypothetical protein